MIGAFFGAMFMGHIYIIAIVTAVQIVSFKEVIAIANVPSRARRLRFTKALNWYWLATTMYFLYGESVIYYFKHIVLVDKVLLPFATHHRFISFMLYVIGKPPSSEDTAAANMRQDSFSSLLLYKPDITGFNLPSSHGHIWLCILLWSRHTSL
jgi:CDP-diglyceride synthetase